MAERYLKAVSPLIRLIVGSLIDELVACYDEREGRGCKSVLILADEATRTAIPSLTEHATTVVGRDISLWVAVQSLKALEVVYGADNAQVLRDNMEHQIYYRPDDLTTAQYLENRGGKKSAFARSETHRESGEVSQGKSEQGIYLMTAQDFMQMKDHQIVLFHRNLPPIKAHRVSWIGNATFEKYRKIPPPKLATIPECEITLNTQAQNQLDGYIDAEMLLNAKRETENTPREIN